MQITSHMAPRRKTAASGPQVAAAPWRSLFLEHVEGMKSPQFTLSTIRRVPVSSSSSFSSYGGTAAADGFSYIPRARTCIFRGMWASLPVNPKNEAELNPDLYESDLPVFTTDVRMDKMTELWETGASAAGEKAQGIEGSGGGGPVEAMFWAEGAMVQWRIRGRAYVLGPDVDESKGGEETRALLKARMRGNGKGKDDNGKGDGEEWGFAREITAHFGNLAPGMRGTFRNPPPGAPVALPVDDGLELGQKVTDLQDEIARKNFRVVVIVPFEVDRTDLSDPARGRRWLYRFVGSGGGTAKPEMPGGEIIDGWEKVELWP